MTQVEQQQLKELFVATALYYGHEMHDQALSLFVADLEDLPFDAVRGALTEIRRDPKTIRCPLPAVIRARLNPVVDPDARAALIANEIVEAISRVGPYQTPYLSDEAKAIVRMEGGWQQICEFTTYDNLPTLKAQWRGLAKGLLQTEFRTGPERQLTSRSGTGELRRLGDLSAAVLAEKDK